MTRRIDWERARPVLERLLELRPEEREAFLREACADDAELERGVRELFAAELAGDEFLEPINHKPGVRRGREVGPYRLLEEIGAGGMGSVWLAERTGDDFEQRVALKLMRSSLDARELLERFRIERRVLAQLEHPGIARLIDGGSSDGTPYFAMEFVEGVPIDRYVKEQNLSVDDRLRLFLEVCEAVAYAHRNLILHRDLKPANILVSDEGKAKLLDFGLAKLLPQAGQDAAFDLTQTGKPLLTPQYASPEQLRAEAVTTATDVYSLGVVLYELLCGFRPYDATTRGWSELERLVCEVDPPKPSVAVKKRNGKPTLARRLARDLDAIALTALQKDHERRYASVDDFANDIRRHLDGLPVQARPDTLRYRTSKFLRRNRGKVGAAVAVMLALGAGATSTLRQHGETLAAWHEEGIQRKKADQRTEDLRGLATDFVFEINDTLAQLGGTLEVREALLDRAQRHLAELRAEEDPDPTLDLELAQAYLNLADARGAPYKSSLGRTLESEPVYQKALELAEDVLERQPEHLHALEMTLLARQKLADIVRASGRFEDAIAEYEALCEVREHHLDSLSPREIDNHANTLRRLGHSYRFEQRDLEAAERSEERAQEVLEQAILEHPDQLGLQLSLGLLLNHRAQTGDVDVREDRNRRAIELMSDVLEADPDQRGALEMLSMGRLGLAQLLAGREENEEALDLTLAGVEGLETLVGQDPQSIGLKKQLSDAHYDAGEVYERMADFEPALEAYSRAAEIQRELVRLDPQNRQYEYALALSIDQCGFTLSHLERPAEALEHFEEARGHLRRLIEGDPEHSTFLLASAINAYGLGEACLGLSRTEGSDEANDLERARLSYEQSFEKLEKLQRSGEVGDQAGKLATLRERLEHCDQRLAELDAQGD